MAYEVPYSFVPGTKAKADEVNANFIDVLGKIQTAKAETIDLLDGIWTKKTLTVCSGLDMNSQTSTPFTCSLSEYLPNDGGLYEVIARGQVTSGREVSNNSPMHILTDYFGNSNLMLCYAKTFVANNVNMAYNTGRVLCQNSIGVGRGPGYVGSGTLVLLGYRKVR